VPPEEDVILNFRSDPDEERKFPRSRGGVTNSAPGRAQVAEKIEVWLDGDGDGTNCDDRVMFEATGRPGRGHGLQCATERKDE
jgi:hypothetical protein